MRYKKCITCNGEGKLTKTCQHCNSPHTCQCPDCKGSGKLPFEELILCECGTKFRCPLTEKHKCKNNNGKDKDGSPTLSIQRKPYTFIIKDGKLIRQCFCNECSSQEEWKHCDTQVIEKPKKEKTEESFETPVMRERAGVRESKQERWEREFGGGGMDF